MKLYKYGRGRHAFSDGLQFSRLALCLSLPRDVLQAENRSRLKSKAFVKVLSSLSKGYHGSQSCKGERRPLRAAVGRRDESRVQG